MPDSVPIYTTSHCKYGRYDNNESYTDSNPTKGKQVSESKGEKPVCESL